MNSEITLLLVVAVLILPASADRGGTDNPLSLLDNTTNYPAAVPYSITLFSATASMIHSNQITDLVNVPNATGTVVLATSFGLSSYNGTWSTRHMTLDNISEGLMEDYITAVEYDSDGRLWIGYSDGIQIDQGSYYQVIRDQQLLKDLRIKDLQRWNDDMWVLTGNAGIHRFHDGIWTWYQPSTKGGPGFYEGDSMAIDPVANMTFIATNNEGLWVIGSQEDPARFGSIATRDSAFGLLTHVRRNPSGGVYFFNKTAVASYTPATNFTIILQDQDLAITRPGINDMAAAPDGKLYLATDLGIFIWDQDHVFRHLDRFEGIGASSTVRWIAIDALGRVWFSTPDNTGFYLDRSMTDTYIPVIPGTPETTAPAASTVPVPGTTPAPVEYTRTVIPLTTTIPSPEGIGAITDPLFQAIHTLLSGFGFG